MKFNNKEEMDELISVMIPAYNAEKQIGECIESLLAQTYENIEIVIVNDGSQDKTQYICEQYVHRDIRVRLINQKNCGVSVARNVGVQAALGKYLCFVDADDYVKPEFIENMIRIKESRNAELVICGFTEIKNKEIVNETSGNLKIMNRKEAMEQLLREDSFKGYVWNKMFDLDIIRKNNISFDESLAVWEDVLFVFQYLMHIDIVVFDPSPMYYYIFGETSVSHGYNHVVKPEKSYSAVRAQQYIYSIIPVEFNRVKNQLVVRLVQSALATIRNIGYIGLSDENRKYYENCKEIIRNNRREVAIDLSAKERFLVILVDRFPLLLLLMYRINMVKNNCGKVRLKDFIKNT